MSPTNTGFGCPTVDLSHNGFTGGVPIKLYGFHGNVDVSFNRLSGPLPEHSYFPADERFVGITRCVNAYGRILRGQEGCLAAPDDEVAARLAAWDPLWNDGC